MSPQYPANHRSITFIRQLNRPLREKIVLSVLMGFGLFTGISAVIKTTYVREFNASSDYFYEVSSLSIWTYVSSTPFPAPSLNRA
jgi:hypothetical protein